MYKKIVVGTDLSDTARIATDRAAALAKGLGSELIIVHAGSDPGKPLEDLAETYGATAVVESGNPVDVLIGEVESRGADLLVVGSVGMTGAKRFMLGNVSNKVSHHAKSDLLIVKTDPPPSDTGPYKKILVGTDGSRTAMKAVETATELSKELGATPVIVCAYEPLSPSEEERLRRASGDILVQWSADRSAESVPEEFRWRIVEATHARDVLERAEDRASEKGVTPEVRAVEGPPAEVLIDTAVAEGFELIVIGSVGMSGAKRFMLGNVPHRVSHHSPVDVLILRTA